MVILVVVGGYVFYDAWKTAKSGGEEKVCALAKWLQSINLPPMMHFKTANVRISMWFTIPIGFATGMLAATIAVGGFIGVPGMIYVHGRLRPGGFGLGTGHRLRHGLRRHHQVGHARYGGHPPDPASSWPGRSWGCSWAPSAPPT